MRVGASRDELRPVSVLLAVGLRPCHQTALDVENWGQDSYETNHDVVGAVVSIGCTLPRFPDDSDLPTLNYRRVLGRGVEVAIVVANAAASSYRVVVVDVAP